MNGTRTWMATSGAARLALYAAFVAHGVFRYRNAPGDDLSSSYIGCRLLASGGSAHLYDFHPELFHVVDTAAWIGAAAEAQFAGFLHPYVQTPLWAWALQPLCTTLSFGAFSLIFLGVALISLAATIEMVSRAWAPVFLRTLPLALLLAAIALSTPYRYAMWLVQTHAVFLMMTVAALLLAQRDRPFVAGALLALACAVKITPGFLLIYWLAGGRRRAAAWFVAWSVALAVVTVAAVGVDLTLDYVRSMRRVADVLLVSYNNQSLAASLAYSRELSSELRNWRMLPLTPLLKIASLAASLAGVALAGWMSRRAAWVGASAALALIVVTIFGPIAWSHYFLALIPAVMILADAGGLLALAAVVLAFILNATPVALDPIDPRLAWFTVVRSHFLSAVVLMVVLVLLCLRPGLGTIGLPRAAERGA